MKQLKRIHLVFLAFFVAACSIPEEQNNSLKQDNNGWENEHRVTKTVGNIIFTFPSSGWAYDRRDSLVQEFPEPMRHDLSLINMTEFTDTIRVVFVNTRKEMAKHTSLPFAGLAYVDIQTIFLLADTSRKPMNLPIKHEMMHMITLSKWGTPEEPELTWMKEGIAALAAGDVNCDGTHYTLDQIYSFLSAKNKLIPLDSLAVKFYGRKEMVVYHQSASIVKYLLDKYGVEKFIKLWQGRFSDFEQVYGVPHKQVESKVEEEIKQKCPAPPHIDWDFFVKGCRK